MCFRVLRILGINECRPERVACVLRVAHEGGDGVVCAGLASQFGEAPQRCKWKEDSEV
jgi:hypothetical protein